MQIKSAPSLWKSQLILPAIRDSFLKLNPLVQRRNIVMFIVELGAILTTVYFIRDLFTNGNVLLDGLISLWLWFTVLFANFSEALAEGRGRAQAASLRKAKSEAVAYKILSSGSIEQVSPSSLLKGDIVLVKDKEIIPSDGDIVEGVALVDESAVTGESAPVIRETGGRISSVTGGTTIVSGKVKVCITAIPGETFLDQMITMVENAKRQKTPNERALELLLLGLTLIFIFVVATLIPFSRYLGVNLPIPVLIALLVCLIPTTIGGLLPAIGIAGMERLLRRNVVVLSARGVEASGNVDVVLMDKTGTITLGNRRATEFIPAKGVTREELAQAALYSSLSDDTPEGRSIVELSRSTLKVKDKDIHPPEEAVFIPFSVETRMSGIDLNGRKIRKGASESIERYINNGHNGNSGIPGEITVEVDKICREGCTPLLVSENSRVLGSIRLKDVMKQGLKERLSNMRKLGIRFIMVTGDNPVTAAAISSEAGMDDFIAQARPEAKLAVIRKYQNEGHMVAMIGDGTNDAPALAQADLAVAMNAGTQAAREAANMVDLDSNPAKLLDIVEIGKQTLMTRGALTTFSIANDIAKYFTIFPAIFITDFPVLNALNIMHLATPTSAILAAIIFNALIIPLLIPLALRGISYKPSTTEALLRQNLLIYGLGGLIVPFIGIKLIDMLLVLLHLG
jgi:potassium-transporting ATPase ATP-binding subunit